MTKTLTIHAAAAALIVVAGCGSDEPDLATRTAANGDEFNNADVAFATHMIPHHAQALELVDLTMEHDLDPKVQQLSDDIRAAQTPEVETMAGWLIDWDEPIPETVRDHAHGDDTHTGSDSEMPGAMSADEMEELERARGDEFQTMWLELMIEHHEGAIEMAETEQTDGTFEPAVDLAASIEQSQQAEITRMEKLLDS
ncbi:MAG: DUF305 domain-containing protein [Nocardioidaceae bacterium]